ncbi:hypothetical protein GCM10025876_21880 [Demequina litorisediminis]|uniref:Alpha-L-arabinofuranosidase C-terminal domain-containing protein n=1 Tax=Demequina litorisediminis TaxID=1849022 RepID=A0ABQ6IGY8_9MICO|nr:hypothetical protein GCM10025876_21880 [Demequina litorisediminis]
MKATDPSIELVACGSSSMQMDTFGLWERTVLSYTYDIVDHISMHAYYEELDGDRASFLGSGTAMERFVERVVASADAIGAQKRSDKRITISFDEWNVWYQQSRFGGEQNLPIQRDAPRIIEDRYSGLDAVVVGDLIVTLLRHADRVAIGCLAQLVNVIAPIMTDPEGAAWRQTTFHPFATAARLATGEALQVKVDTDTIATAKHGDVPAITAAATVDPDTGALALFVTNRSDQERTVTLRHPGVTARIDGGTAVLADHEGARETQEHAEAYAPVDALPVEQGEGTITLRLAPESWTAFHGAMEL